MKLLEELIAANTYLGDYTKIISIISDFVHKNTNGEVILQEISEKKANIIVRFGQPELLINCHMDTVPPATEWGSSPLVLLEKNECFYGLGTADTKGNLYAILKAVESVKPKNLMLVFSIDEELGSKTGVKYFLESEYKAGIKRAIVCEPTNLKFVNRHKGYFSFWITHKADAKHSSIVSKGAIIQAAETILKLEDNGFNVGIIEGGKAGNIVSEYCKFKVSIRTYDSYEIVHKKLKELVSQSESVQQFGVQNVESEPIAKLAVIESAFTGSPLVNTNPLFEGEFHEVDFWTEAALFGEQGISTIVFGGGNIKQAHGRDEFIEKSQLQEAQKIIEKLIEKMIS